MFNRADPYSPRIVIVANLSNSLPEIAGKPPLPKQELPANKLLNGRKLRNDPKIAMESLQKFFVKK